MKDEFYEQLQKEVETSPRHDMLVIMGDANAKVGEENERWERAKGRHEIGTMNENDERRAELCTLNDFVIGGILFKHRDIHKWKGHLDKVLNIDSARTNMPSNIGFVAAQKLPEITTSEISEAEIGGFISGLNNRKYPEMDSISAEMLTCTQGNANKTLNKLFNKIMAEQEAPSD
ncbi:hypothetical protein ACROYT_G041827 [Oculina patagonica]